MLPHKGHNILQFFSGCIYRRAPYEEDSARARTCASTHPCTWSRGGLAIYITVLQNSPCAKCSTLQVKGVIVSKIVTHTRRKKTFASVCSSVEAISSKDTKPQVLVFLSLSPLRLNENKPWCLLQC